MRVAPCVLGDVYVSALVKARDLSPALKWIFQSEDRVLVVPGKGEKETETLRGPGVGQPP